MKQIALLITDTHLSESNIPLVTDIWKQAIEVCKEKKLKTILFGGDFFHSRKGQPLSVIVAGRKIVDMLSEHNIQLVGIAGNHDKSDYESEDSYLDIYNSPNFRIYKNQTITHINGTKIALLPYFRESGSYIERLERIKGKADLLLTHIAIMGSINNDNQMVENAIPSTQFKGFKTNFIGHFHNRHSFENIHYIGSTYQANYGEDPNKGFAILHDNGELEYIQSKFPKFTKYEIDVKDLDSATLADLKKEKEENANIKIVIKGDESKVKSFDTSLLSEIGLSYELKQNNALSDISDDEVRQTITHDKKSIQSAFKSFCEVNKIEDKEYGLEKLKNL